jgi:hypothetical protein
LQYDVLDKTFDSTKFQSLIYAAINSAAVFVSYRYYIEVRGSWMTLESVDELFWSSEDPVKLSLAASKGPPRRAQWRNLSAERKKKKLATNTKRER